MRVFPGFHRHSPWRLVPVAVLCLAACARETGSIVIGLAGPMGDALGVAELRAARLAVDQINQRGGVDGRALRLRVMDDSGTEIGALRVAQSLYDDPAVAAVVGHVTSGTTIAAARIYGGGTDPLPVISPTASSPELSGLSPFVFRVCPSDLSHGPALARFAYRTLRAHRAGIVYLNDDYGRGVRQAFTAEFTRLGGVVVEQDPFLPLTSSLEPYVSRMRAGGVDVLMIAADVPGAELALREVRRQRLSWPVIGSDALVGIEADGPLAEGVHVSSAYLPDRSGDKNAAFVVDFLRATQGQRPNDVAGLTYDSIQLLASALDAVGSDRRALRDYLASVGGRQHPSFEGVTGRIAFDANGDVPGKPLAIAVVHNGRLVAEASE
jgi:branched-chain amino acid transport system substrate-binding protein